jgi:hypothetical protein
VSGVGFGDQAIRPEHPANPAHGLGFILLLSLFV